MKRYQPNTRAKGSHGAKCSASQHSAATQTHPSFYVMLRSNWTYGKRPAAQRERNESARKRQHPLRRKMENGNPSLPLRTHTCSRTSRVLVVNVERERARERECVCVRERERERERASERESERERARERESETERERERGRERKRAKERHSERARAR